MFKSQRSLRFTAVRFAIVAAIGFSFLTFTVIGTNAAGLSFFDTVKEFFGLQTAPAAGAAARDQPSAPFTACDLVIYRVGDGVASLTNFGSPVFLDEYTTGGTLVQSIAMPTTASGAQKQLIASGTSTSEGLLARSADGNFLTLTGYASDLGGATSLTGTTSAAVNRTIGRVSVSAAFDTSTALTDAASGASPRSAVSSDGTDIWIDGGAGGIRYTTFGGTTSTQLSTTVTNLRQAHIFAGQLYTSNASGTNGRIGTVGSGLPTTAGQTITGLPGFPTTGSSYGFFFADLDGSAGLDTVYVADDSTPGSIQKYSLVAGNWTASGSVAAALPRGLTGFVNGTSVALFATTGASAAAGGGSLYAVTDTSGYNATMTGTVATIATAATNTAFRGVALTPGTGSCAVATSTNTGTPTITATNTPTGGPTSTNTNTPTATNTGTPTNTATNTATATPTQTPPTGPTFVISQVYGGGGGSGAYEYDYVEIKNITASVQSLNLLKLYYGSALGNFASSSTNEFILPNVSLNPGQFYLVQVGPQGTGAVLPVTPDAITGNLNMSQSSGKIALVTGLLGINVCGSSGTPCDATQLSYIVDWVAYGAAGNGAVNVGENGNPSVNNGVPVTNADGGVRKIAGCQDTNNNNADFDVASPPIPRNTSTTFLCNGFTPTSTPSLTATDTPTGTPSATNTATETATATNTTTPTPTQTPPTGPTFVLSQVYGGGGANTGTPTYTNDYVEIKNVTASPQNLDLLKLYYGSDTGNFASSGSNRVFLPAVTLNPGQFYLVQLGTSGTAGAALPVTPDLVTTNINMSAGSGKIALVTGLLGENVCGSTAVPCDATQLSYIVDWVAYGAGGNGGNCPTCGEGGNPSVNNGVAVTNVDGGVRKSNGCQDTNNNNNDFDVVSPPVPRNSSTTAACGGGGGGTVSGAITYGNPIGNPVPPRFVRNVSLASTVGSPAVGPVLTGVPGTYTLMGFGAGAYTIRPTKPGGPNTAVSSNDAARVAQGVSGAVPFVSQNQRFSADTSGNGGVTSNDAALIARFAAGLTGTGVTGQWRFFVTGAPSPLPTVPQTYNDSRSYASVTAALTGEDFVALLVGEVSGNYNPATHARSAVGPERMTSVEAPRLLTPADSEVIIPVSVTGAAGKEIISYEFDLRYDPAVIQPQADPVDVTGTVSRGLLAVANPNEPGLLRVVLYGAYPIEANGLLLNLKFNAVGAPGSVSPLTFERMIFNEGDPGTLATDGLVQLSGASANQAEITGRLLNSTGQGIPNARVTLTDTTGETRSIMSNSFGVYRFGGLQVGQTFTISVESRKIVFTPMTVSVTGQSINVDMIAGQ